MPNKPTVKTLTANTADVLNAIRKDGSEFYQSEVPIADYKDVNTLRAIGSVLLDYEPLRNEFLTKLWNRIGRVLLSSRLYSNPWSMFKKGLLEFGETVEDIFVDIVKAHDYDPEVAEEKVFKREIPDVRAVFYTMNYQKFYKTTIQNENLRQAFLSWDGVDSLIAKIVDALYTSENYDEFLTMKYMLAYNIWKGRMRTVTIPSVTTENMKSIVSVVKGESNAWEFLSTDYNSAGVHTLSDKSSQYMIVSAKFDATMDVEVLASAFNMDKTQFSGQKVLVDSFGTLDVERLDELLASDANYHHFTTEELAQLDSVPAILVDKDFFMIFDNLNAMEEMRNSEGLYWNYWLHAWKTFAISPYANNAMFYPGVQSVDEITITPTEVTISPGYSAQLFTTVTGTGFVSQEVTFTSADDNIASVNANGVVVVNKSATKGSTVVITATANADESKTATATITVG